MKTWYVPVTYYGGDIRLIEQAAQEHQATLVAVGDLAVQDIPEEERGFCEGNVSFLFTLKDDDVRNVSNRLAQIQRRATQLWWKQEHAQQKKS